jgi:hypothetical protein
LGGPDIDPSIFQSLKFCAQHLDLTSLGGQTSPPHLAGSVAIGHLNVPSGQKPRLRPRNQLAFFRKAMRQLEIAAEHLALREF